LHEDDINQNLIFKPKGYTEHMKGSGIAEKIKKAVLFLNENLELLEVKYMAIQRCLI
jgi:hypothetical protein